jgi:hypothetical protein
VSYTDRIKEVIDGADVAIFMKGTPAFAMCGNSDRALSALRRAGAPVTAIDVLPDPQIRQDLSAISGWPTARSGDRDRDRCADDLGDRTREHEPQPLQRHQPRRVERHHAREQVVRGGVAHAQVEAERVQRPDAGERQQRQRDHHRRVCDEDEVGDEGQRGGGRDETPLAAGAERPDAREIAEHHPHGERDEPHADE